MTEAWKRKAWDLIRPQYSGLVCVGLRLDAWTRTGNPLFVKHRENLIRK